MSGTEFFKFTEKEQEEINNYQKERLQKYGEEMGRIKAAFKEKNGKEWDDVGGKLVKIEADKVRYGEKSSEKNLKIIYEYRDTLIKILSAGVRYTSDLGAFSVKVAKEHISKYNVSTDTILGTAESAIQFYINQIGAVFLEAVREKNPEKITDKIPLESIFEQDGKYIIKREVAENLIDEYMGFFYELLANTPQLDELDAFIENELDGASFVDNEGDGDAGKKSHARRKRIARPAVISAIKPDAMTYPVDIVSLHSWNLYAKKKHKYKGLDGQLSFNDLAFEGETAANFDVGKDKADKKKHVQIPVTYSINFEGLPENLHLPKYLTEYDKRVYMACGAIKDVGNKQTTLTQIYYVMGNTSKPNSKQIKKIHDSIVKMIGAVIFFDNIAESNAYKSKRHVNYYGALLPADFFPIIDEKGNRVEEGGLRFRVYPDRPNDSLPLIEIARKRGQITTLKTEYLQIPMNMTEDALTIQDYLFIRISRDKNADKNRKAADKKHYGRILYETFFNATQRDTKKRRQRAPEQIKTILDHLQKTGMIKGYTFNTVNSDGKEVDKYGEPIKRNSKAEPVPAKDGFTFYF